VVAILQKALALNLVTDLGIKAAFSHDGIEGSVYVECFTLSGVQQILYGVSGILLSKGKTQIDLVPLEDRINLLKMASIPSTITIEK
jgi:hypothetical protein